MSTVDGMDSLAKKLDSLARQKLLQDVTDAAAEVYGRAKMLAPSTTGELRQSIRYEVTSRNGGDTVTGEVYTKKPYAIFVEFGTGPVGERYHDAHADEFPDMSLTYTQRPWFIHESQVDRSTAERAKWPYFDTDDGRFYICSGMAARPYLYPALHDVEKKLSGRIISEYIARIKRT